MLLWLLIAILATLVALALFFSVRVKRDDTLPAGAANEHHFRLQLDEIEDDVRVGRLSADQAEAAKTELARELVRFRKENAAPATTQANSGQRALIAVAIAAPIAAVAMYLTLGQPDMPAMPLATRAPEPATEITFDEAVSQIELRLAETPDDIRGWRVLGPAYMRAGRFGDAESAFRRILELSEPDAGTLTDLAEAMLMQTNGVAGTEIMALLNQAATIDPRDVRSRFYLAGEATRIGDWDNAVSMWQELIALAEGGEPWLQVARDGLGVAQRRGEAPPENASTGPDAADQQEMIRGMVEQLSTRLAEDGGSVEEWTRLVRSRLVLGETDLAQQAYETAVAAYPDQQGREELDDLARAAGLVIDE